MMPHRHQKKKKKADELTAEQVSLKPGGTATIVFKKSS